MQESDPRVLPILRTDTQRDLLFELYFAGNGPRTLSDLARAIDVSQTTVMREVNRLLESGVVVEERVGRSRTVRINDSSPYAAPLRQIMRIAHEPETPGAGHGTRHGGFHEPGTRHDRRPLPSSMRRR